MLRETAKQLANTLDPDRFVWIHHSTIVNMDDVREVAREGRSEGSVILTRGQRLKMSKAGVEEFDCGEQVVLTTRT
jgi:two-component system LytT family response regulator